jgi:hypothetical protein
VCGRHAAQRGGGDNGETVLQQRSHALHTGSSDGVTARFL